MWLPALFFAAASLGSFVLIRKIKRASRASMMRCAACGYDLRATPDRCPECGTVPAASSREDSLSKSTSDDPVHGV
jgi:rRNA maturation endonuclease Nob1